MRILNVTTASLASLLDLIEKQPGGYRHLFRGQSDSTWGLTPALYRNTNLNIGGGTKEKNYDHFEQQCIERFFDQGMPYLPALTRDYSNDRILAQHFGVPTRLLDWTRDPLVAAFFATENRQPDTDAAIFMVLPDAQYRPEWAKSTGPHQTILLDPPAIDRRIPAQKSAFTYHPYGPSDGPFVPLDQREDIGNWITAENGLTRGFAKIVIPKHIKGFLHHTLLELGIDRRNLFPGLDGVGADLAARSRLGQIW